MVYDYAVAGKPYTGERISHTLVFGSFYNDALLARYPAGAEVRVYYNPSRPEQAVLERRIPTFYWIVFTAAAIAFGIGVSMWIREARRERAMTHRRS